MVERTFKKVENTVAYWKPDSIGETIEGDVISIGTHEEYGLQVTINADGVNTQLPSHKVLQNRLKSVKVGNYIKVQFTGEELPKVKGQNPTKMYDVFIAE